MLEYVRKKICRRYSSHYVLNDLHEFMSKAYSGLEHITDITHQCLDTNEVDFFSGCICLNMQMILLY